LSRGFLEKLLGLHINREDSRQSGFKKSRPAFDKITCSGISGTCGLVIVKRGKKRHFSMELETRLFCLKGRGRLALLPNWKEK